MARTTVGRSLNASAVTLGQASEAFRMRCQAQNLSPGTLIWCGKEVTPNLIRLSFKDMRRRGVSQNTTNGILPIGPSH